MEALVGVCDTIPTDLLLTISWYYDALNQLVGVPFSPDEIIRSLGGVETFASVDLHNSGCEISLYRKRNETLNGSASDNNFFTTFSHITVQYECADHPVKKRCNRSRVASTGFVGFDIGDKITPILKRKPTVLLDVRSMFVLVLHRLVRLRIDNPEKLTKQLILGFLDSLVERFDGDVRRLEAYLLVCIANANIQDFESTTELARVSKSRVITQQMCLLSSASKMGMHGNFHFPDTTENDVNQRNNELLRLLKTKWTSSARSQY